MLLRKYWIPLLVFIVAIVGVGLYYLQTRPPKDPILIVKPVEYEKPTAEAPVVEPPQPDGHFKGSDGDRFDVSQPRETPSPSVGMPASEVSAPVGSGMPRFHDPSFRIMDGFLITSKFAMSIAPLSVGPDFAAMSAEELADAIATINAHDGWPPGDLHPPEGYHYPSGGNPNRGTTEFFDSDNVWLDDNGHPILSKDHTPFYEIDWSENGFRPPPDVYADYNALWKLRLWSETPEEEARITAEMDAIVAKYRGPVPDGSWVSGASPSGTDPYTYFTQFDWVENQMKRMAFEEAGIAYLMDNYSSLKEFAK